MVRTPAESSTTIVSLQKMRLGLRLKRSNTFIKYDWCAFMIIITRLTIYQKYLELQSAIERSRKKRMQAKTTYFVNFLLITGKAKRFK